MDDAAGQSGIGMGSLKRDFVLQQSGFVCIQMRQKLRGSRRPPCGMARVGHGFAEAAAGKMHFGEHCARAFALGGRGAGSVRTGQPLHNAGGFAGQR